MWFNILQNFGLDALAPHLNDLSFEDWWARASDKVSVKLKMGPQVHHHLRCLVPVEPPQLFTLFAATSQQYFSLTPNQHQPPSSQQYFSLTTNQHQPQHSEQCQLCFQWGYSQHDQRHLVLQRRSMVVVFGLVSIKECLTFSPLSLVQLSSVSLFWSWFSYLLERE